MEPFIDYYAVLSVEPRASADEIRAAFKQLALQYHPDVYKGPDANERMRVLLRAYHTLIDPAQRKAYDAQRSEHVAGRSARPMDLYPGRASSASARPSTDAAVSPGARRDRQRYYDFPDLAARLRTLRDSGGVHTSTAIQVRLGEVIYNLSQEGAEILLRNGVLRGVILDTAGPSGPLNSFYVESSEPGIQKRYRHYCHRCHHRWTTPSLRNSPAEAESHSEVCPACGGSDWNEYLLLRCSHCGAVFESEQIRYEIGSYRYGDEMLCPPYELFPLCPYCSAANWCPAEDARLDTLRARLARRAAILRVVWISIGVVVVLVLGAVLVMMAR